MGSEKTRIPSFVVFAPPAEKIAAGNRDVISASLWMLCTACYGGRYESAAW